MADDLQLGMFVAGVVMAAAPVAVGVGITVFLVRLLLREKADEKAARRSADAHVPPPEDPRRAGSPHEPGQARDPIGQTPAPGGTS